MDTANPTTSTATIQYCKAVHFAQPSSPAAEQLGRSQSGCHYVTGDDRPNARKYGPYSSVEQAEREAERLFPARPWYLLYVKYPLPGSRFFVEPNHPGWDKRTELVGRRVVIYTDHDEPEEATVAAMHRSNSTILVVDDEGRRLVGNQWDDL